MVQTTIESPSKAHKKETLKKAYERLKHIIDVSPIVIYTSEIKGNKWINTFVSENVKDILGYESRDFTENPDFWIEHVHPDDIEKLHSKPSLLPKEGRHAHEYRFLHKNGTFRWMFNELVVETDPKGKPLGCVGYWMDITERKQAEEKIRELKEKYEQLIKNIPDAVYSSYPTSKGLSSFVSDRWKDWTGYSPEDFQKDQNIWAKFIHPEDRKRVAEGWDEAFRQKKEFVCEYRVVHRDTGETRYLRGHATPVTDEKGNVIRFDGIATDITESKKAERTIRENQNKLKAMNEKLNVVGKLTMHDLQNKLSEVIGNIYLAKKRLTPENEVFHYLKSIESAANQMERILNFARVYQMLGVEELVWVDAGEYFDEAVSLLPDLSGVKVMNNCRGMKVLADSLLRQLFYNLIENSLKHGEKVSQIRIYCKEGRNQHKLIYEDDGVGIPKAEKEKIFKEGYGKDAGHGLYLIRKMCEAYGWTIKETGKPGKGAHYTLIIPKDNARIGKELIASMGKIPVS